MSVIQKDEVVKVMVFDSMQRIVSPVKSIQTLKFYNYLHTIVKLFLCHLFFTHKEKAHVSTRNVHLPLLLSPTLDRIDQLSKSLIVRDL